MITDEIIRTAAKNRLYSLYGDPSDVHGIVQFARDLIALAQEVRPLVWELNKAKTPFGTYFTSLHRQDNMYSVWRDGHFVIDQKFYTETAARAAAQADFNRRVLENLTHGVADEN